VNSVFLALIEGKGKVKMK